MPVAIGTTAFESVDFCNLATVKAEIDATVPSTANDSEISRGITDVSAAFTRWLGFHTLIGTRTDTYMLRHGKRMLTLDSRPVTAVSSLLIAQHPNDFGSATEVDARDYVIRQQAGAIKFSRRMWVGTCYVKVVYTAGLAANATGMETDYPELARACSSQVRYMVMRRDSLGGDVKSIAGGATTFNSQYNWLSTVRSVLDAHRRQAV